MKATKLKSGMWTVNVYLGKDAAGKQIRRRVTGPDRKTVLAEAAQFAAEHRDVSDPHSIGTAAKAVATRSDLSPSTLRGYAVCLRYLEDNEPDFLRIPCYALRSEDLQHVIDRAKAKYKPKTVRNIHGFIASALKLSHYSLPVVDLPAKEAPAYTIPDETAVREILAAAKDEDRELWIVIALAAFGPLRAGEIAALQFTFDQDVDFRTQTIHVSHDYVYGADKEYHLKPPKTATSDRVLSMPNWIMNAIEEQGYVTTWNGNQIYKHFTRFLTRHNFPRYRFHDLRHFCASYLHAKGYPDIYIQQRTGHASADVLRHVYTHALDDQAKLMSRRMLLDFAEVVNENVNETNENRHISG